MNKTRLLIALVLLAAIAAFFIFDLQQYLSLEFFKLKRAQVDAYYAEHPWQTAAIFLVAYIAMAALSIPGATVLTLIGGAIFGLVVGTVLVSFASAIGATLAFLASRLLLRDWVQSQVRRPPWRSINAGIEKEGAFYLFALRLVPLFPFFVVNLLMGLTKIRTWTFYWVSQLGMLAGTIVYVYAGTELGEFEVSAGLVIAFVLLGIFPLVGEEGARRNQGAQGLCKVEKQAACVVRLQPGRDRRRFGWARVGLHRRGDQGEGCIDRKTQDGRRLPEHGLRAIKGADPIGEAAVAHCTLA